MTIKITSTAWCAMPFGKQVVIVLDTDFNATLSVTASLFGAAGASFFSLYTLRVSFLEVIVNALR